MKDLLFFYGDGCSHCGSVLDIVDRLNSEGFNIKKIEVWNNKENDKLLMSIDNGEDCCGGVPFFFNQNTNKKICGEASYKEIKNWAESK
jgi:hypothetical protein